MPKHRPTPRPSLGDFAWAEPLRAARRAQGDPTITGIVHTRNEEANLPDALRSLGWVDDLLVVDMESEDATCEIAREHGARVIQHPNLGYVEPARKAALEAATGDWVIVLDADERVLEPLAELLAGIVREDGADVVELPRRNWLCGQWLRASGWTGVFHTRFFRRGHVMWGDRIHSLPEVHGRVVRVAEQDDLCIQHFNYDDLNHFLEKLNRYTDKEADALEAEPPASWDDAARRARIEFLHRWTPAQDGALSTALSVSMLLYRYISHAKHWERLGYPDIGAPADPRTALRQLASDAHLLHRAGLEAAGAGRDAEAAELVRRGVADAVELEQLNDLGVLLARLGRADDARAVLTTCTLLDPTDGAARENLAALDLDLAA